jgi:hypothetical protein
MLTREFVEQQGDALEHAELVARVRRQLVDGFQTGERQKEED